ncbi:hypothetical protein RIF29_04961 [Crotalaria pallida]|uniref:Uncharacterized protein n=1 Tax=Crotalaria pallida TaxID=3830 RepID=A0AAN9PA35_CROPI
MESSTHRFHGRSSFNQLPNPLSPNRRQNPRRPQRRNLIPPLSHRPSPLPRSLRRLRTLPSLARPSLHAIRVLIDLSIRVIQV